MERMHLVDILHYLYDAQYESTQNILHIHNNKPNILVATNLEYMISHIIDELENYTKHRHERKAKRNSLRVIVA